MVRKTRVPHPRATLHFSIPSSGTIVKYATGNPPSPRGQQVDSTRNELAGRTLHPHRCGQSPDTAGPPTFGELSVDQRPGGGYSKRRPVGNRLISSAGLS